jgi:hypothetical protein
MMTGSVSTTVFTSAGCSWALREVVIAAAIRVKITDFMTVFLKFVCRTNRPFEMLQEDEKNVE